MRECIKLIRQALAKLPGASGGFRSANRKFVPPPRAELGQSMEAVIHHFKLWTEGFNAPDREVYTAMESRAAKSAAYLHGTAVTCRARSFTSASLCIQASRRCQKTLFADLVAIVVIVNRTPDCGR